MGEGVPDDDALRGPNGSARLGAISVDWWATVVAGVSVALAVADVLPKIPW